MHTLTIQKLEPPPFDVENVERRNGYGSIPIDTFLVG
jgi:hypothetical protein